MGGTAFSEIRELLAFLRELRRFNKDRIGYLERRRRTDGKNFTIDSSELVVTDSAVARKVLQQTDATSVVSADLYASADPIDEALEVTVDWLPVRAAAIQAIHRRQLPAYVRRMRQVLAAALSAPGGRVVDVVEALNTASATAVSDLLLGDDAAGAAGLTIRAQQANLALMDGSLWPRRTPWSGLRRQARADRALRARIGEIVERRRGPAAAGARPDVVRTLLAEENLTSRQVQGALHVLLTASFGLPGAATAWAALALLRRPELAAAARAAANAVENVEHILDQAPLLVAIVKETLRCYPPIWMPLRIASEPIEVADLRIPAGSTVHVAIYLIHRDAGEWDAPEEFEPRRWLEPDRYRRGAYLPFGYGPRMCIGSHLAMFDIVTMLHLLLTEYELVDARIDDRPVATTQLLPRRFSARIVPR